MAGSDQVRDDSTGVTTSFYVGMAPPEGYECAYCKAGNVRLLREEFEMRNGFACHACAMGIETDQVWIPAIPTTKEATEYFCRTKMPSDGLAWWEAMPQKSYYK